MRVRLPPPDAARESSLLAHRRFLAGALAGLCVLAVPHASAAAKPPASALSRRAVKRRAAALETDLRKQDLSLGAPVFLRITKNPGVLEAFLENANREFVSFRRYPICAFSGALGPKLRTGDGQAPEGFYFVRPDRMNPYSAYHLSFDLGYPNAYDRALGRTGSALMVHGNCVSIGCYAMGDDAIEEIWTLMSAAFEHGQAIARVHAFPFPMNTANMKTHAKSPNFAFWSNLQEGWDWFETARRPPNVRVRDGAYLFSGG